MDDGRERAPAQPPLLVAAAATRRQGEQAEREEWATHQVDNDAFETDLVLERAALDKYATQRDLDFYSAEHEAQQVAAAIAASLREASARDIASRHITPAKRPLSGA